MHWATMEGHARLDFLLAGLFLPFALCIRCPGPLGAFEGTGALVLMGLAVWYALPLFSAGMLSEAGVRSESAWCLLPYQNQFHAPDKLKAPQATSIAIPRGASPPVASRSPGEVRCQFWEPWTWVVGRLGFEGAPDKKCRDAVRQLRSRCHCTLVPGRRS